MRTRRASASGLINTSQQIGGALGLAILASIANSRTDNLVADGEAMASALTDGFRLAFIVGAGFAVLGAILAATLISSKASREHAGPRRRGDVARPCRRRARTSPGAAAAEGRPGRLR